MGFAEFASFTCQLDEETIKQHVTAMVVVSQHFGLKQYLTYSCCKYICYSLYTKLTMKIQMDLYPKQSLITSKTTFLDWIRSRKLIKISKFVETDICAPKCRSSYVQALNFIKLEENKVVWDVV